MVKIEVFVVTILLLELVVGSLGCRGGQPGPEDTVRQMFAACEAGDLHKAASYMTTEQPEWLIEQQQGMIREVDIQNLDLSVISESENEATLKAAYDIEFKGAVFNEFIIKQHNTQTVKLVRVNGRWLISDIVETD